MSTESARQPRIPQHPRRMILRLSARRGNACEAKHDPVDGQLDNVAVASLALAGSLVWSSQGHQTKPPDVSELGTTGVVMRGDWRGHDWSFLRE